MGEQSNLMRGRLRNKELPQRAVCGAVGAAMLVCFGLIDGLVIIGSILGILWVWETVE